MFIFDRCHHSLPVGTPTKYEHNSTGSNQLSKSKISLWEIFTELECPPPKILANTRIDWSLMHTELGHVAVKSNFLNENVRKIHCLNYRFNLKNIAFFCSNNSASHYIEYNCWQLNTALHYKIHEKCISIPLFVPVRPTAWQMKPSNLSYKTNQIIKLKCFSSHLAVVFARSTEARW